VVVLEELGHALARGAHAYAEVLSFSSVGNAYHMSDLPEDGAPMARAIEAALSAPGVDPSGIGYINAHGSSTPQNDLFETNAYKQVFRRQAYRIPISSTKSMIGHSLSSASLMGVAAALGAIERSVIHPTANLECPDPRCDLDYVPNRGRRADLREAMVTASGFGGIHSAAVFGKCGGHRG
jgi:3-oxoacyl-(acyl-carrier-protein) synthase